MRSYKENLPQERGGDKVKGDEPKVKENKTLGGGVGR